MCNFTNRIANAMGWVPNEEYYYQHREKSRLGPWKD